MRPLVHQWSWYHILLVLGAVTATVTTSKDVCYDKHKLYEIHIEPGTDLRIKREIARHTTLDHSQRQQNLNVTLLVDPLEVPKFESLLKTNNVSHKALDINFQRMIDDESKGIKPMNSSATDFDWKNFYQLETIYAWLDLLAEKYSDIITLLNIGTSYEGRPLKGVKLSHRNNNTAVFIEAGIHAREWIGPSTATFILNQLLTSSDANVQNVARNFDWIIFPVCNPDGYKYTFDGDRLWRKNREPFGSCVGVDLNRNWNRSWNKGSGEEANEPCGINYPGPYAFSAPETKHLQRYLRDSVKSQHIHTYVSFHAAAQKLLYPYSGNKSYPTNNGDLERIGEKATEALFNSSGTQFETGNAYHIMYEATGTSMDWVYGELNIPIVFTYELRRSKIETENYTDRFLLPIDQIEPAAWETFESVMTILNEAKALGYYQHNFNPLLVAFYALGYGVLLILTTSVIFIIGVYFAKKYKLYWSRRADDRILMLYHA